MTKFEKLKQELLDACIEVTKVYFEKYPKSFNVSVYEKLDEFISHRLKRAGNKGYQFQCVFWYTLCRFSVEENIQALAHYIVLCNSNVRMDENKIYQELKK